MEVLREATLRMPQQVGGALSIVGVLVIGQAAVAAGFVSPITVVVVALTMIGSFATPAYDAAIALRMLRFPNKTIIRYSEDILGKWAAREFGAVVVSSVLRETPLEVTVIVMLILAAINSRHDFTVFAYIHHFYLPVLVAPGLLIVILSLKNANMLNIPPLLGNTPQAGSMMNGVLTIAALFQGSFIYTLVIPAMRRPERAMKAAFWGMAIAGGLYLLIVIATVSVFGAQEIRLLLWPTLELARTTTLPANILERLDAPFLIIWVIAVFSTLFSSYYLMIHSASELFRLRDHKMFSFFALPFVFVIAMFPQNVLELYQIIQIVGKIGLILTITYPLLLLVISIDLESPEAQTEEAEISHLAGKFPTPTESMVRLTAQIAVPGRIPLGPGEGGGGGGGKKPVWVVQVVGHTLDDAMANLHQQLADRIFFNHLRVIIISEEFARKGVGNVNEYLRRNPEVRRAAWMFVSKGKAATTMEIAPELERVPTLYLMSTLDHAVSLGKFPNDFLGIFWSASSSLG